MTAAIITPLEGGKAILEIDGVIRPFPSWFAASDEAEAQGRFWLLEPFQPTPLVIELVPAAP